MKQERRVIPVVLLVRPRGSAANVPYERVQFRAHAFSPHHAEQQARAYAEKKYEVGHVH